MNFDERFYTNLLLAENSGNKKILVPLIKKGREFFTPAVPPTLVRVRTQLNSLTRKTAQVNLFHLVQTRRRVQFLCLLASTNR